MATILLISNDDLNLQPNPGGICVFDTASVRMRVLPFLSFKTFELLPLFLPPQPGAFVIIYRPSSESAIMECVNKLADMLENCSRYVRRSIVSDMNIDMDNPGDVYADLVVRIQQPIHRITRAADPTPYIRIDKPLQLSDHLRRLMTPLLIHSFIQTISTVPLQVHYYRGAPDTARILCLSFTPKRQEQRRRYCICRRPGAKTSSAMSLEEF